MSSPDPDKPLMAQRFRGFLPVIVDVETGGFDQKKDALLEIGAVTVKIDDDGHFSLDEEYACHIEPFEGSNMDPKSMEINGIDPYHPFRMAKPEDDAIRGLFKFSAKAMKKNGCHRAIMVGHNTIMDLNFINAAATRCKVARNPFHPFSVFDTVSLAGLAYGQTVLSRSAQAAGLPWDTEQAHSALYDAKQTAELFCAIVNRWTDTSGPVWS
ncbi:MAG: ribonuclease T [Gammaproteobacteria bacterium]|nr:ribonuclease T [Gammaproteobacteria bacterium]